MRALGLDVGSKTIGLALSDETGVVATAWGVWSRLGHAKDAAEIRRRIDEETVGALIVGFPLELDGREGRRARAVRRFLEVLEPELGGIVPPVNVILWDERFSTVAAERTLLEADLSRAKRKLKIDAVAAQFILQGWLDSRQGWRDGGGRDKEGAD